MHIFIYFTRVKTLITLLKFNRVDDVATVVIVHFCKQMGRLVVFHEHYDTDRIEHKIKDSGQGDETHLLCCAKVEFFQEIFDVCVKSLLEPKWSVALNENRLNPPSEKRAFFRLSIKGILISKR